MNALVILCALLYVATALKEDAGNVKFCKYYNMIIMSSIRWFTATYIYRYILAYTCIHLTGPPGPPGMQHKMANVQHASWHHQNTRAQQGSAPGCTIDRFV